MSDDLMAAIKAQADRTDDAKPKMCDLVSLANDLCRTFKGHTVHDIYQKLVVAWRDRELL